MSAPSDAATITPRPDAPACDREHCAASELLAEVDPDGEEEPRILCPTHRVEYLREVAAP